MISSRRTKTVLGGPWSAVAQGSTEIMRQLTKDMPINSEAPGMTIRNVRWGEMVIGYLELPVGTDFTPIFEGLPNDACDCPHGAMCSRGQCTGVMWLEPRRSRAQVTRSTGRGDTPGASRKLPCLIDFSPEVEFMEVPEHLAKKMADAGQPEGRALKPAAADRARADRGSITARSRIAPPCPPAVPPARRRRGPPPPRGPGPRTPPVPATC